MRVRALLLARKCACRRFLEADHRTRAGHGRAVADGYGSNAELKGPATNLIDRGRMSSPMQASDF